MSGTCECGGPIYHGRCADPKRHAGYEREQKIRAGAQEGGRIRARQQGSGRRPGSFKKGEGRPKKEKEEKNGKDGKDDKKKGRW